MTMPGQYELNCSKIGKISLFDRGESERCYQRHWFFFKSGLIKNCWTTSCLSQVLTYIASISLVKSPRRGRGPPKSPHCDHGYVIRYQNYKVWIVSNSINETDFLIYYRLPKTLFLNWAWLSAILGPVWRYGICCIS